MDSKKVFVGLSGGVDSAVSAALLKEQGFDVTGVFITIAIPGYPCPAAEDRVSAMRVAAHLDIPFLEVDLSKEYKKQVFDPSIEEWKHGATPNPDTRCNEKIKFGVFFDWCRERGAECVATGHYAQVFQAEQKQVERSVSQADGPRGSEFSAENYATPRDFVSVKHNPTEPSLARALRAARPSPTLAPGSSVELCSAADSGKDQTYFLWAVPQEKLVHTLFPVGNLEKSAVRTRASKFGLPNAARPDSQGLCFLGDISLEHMLEQELQLVAGRVLNEQGEVVGRHFGAVRYTLGQRHGFELTAQGPDTPPHFVVAKDIAPNTITVSAERTPRGKTKTTITLSDTNWIGAVKSGACMARYRYRQTLIPAELCKDKRTVILKEPHFVPEGQSLVLYRDESSCAQGFGRTQRCLGGGVIESAKIE